MNRSLYRFVPLLAIALVAAWPRPVLARYGPMTLADSTVIESWRLSNGLRVVTRHIPMCGMVDVTVAYGFGSGDDPAGREGLHALLSEVAYFGATAEAPERTRSEMPGLRPAGWDLVISPRAVQFSELAGVATFPGVLHQVAVRMRGVNVTSSGLRASVSAVRGDLDGNYRSNVDRALYYAAREWATGGGEARAARYASGKGLEGLTVREVQQRVSRAFVPSNAVLSVTGNLSTVPVRTLIEREFGSIPAGTPLPPAATRGLDSVSVIVARPEVRKPAGVVGLFTPALTDTAHPGFLMRLLLVAGHCSQRWGAPEPPLTSRFQYSILVDPEIARFYPPVDPGSSDPRAPGERLMESLRDVDGMATTPETVETLWGGVDWLLGGPLPPAIGGRALTEGGTLHVVGSGMAIRELWGGEPFWAEYRRRFRNAIEHPLGDWFRRMADPGRRVQILFRPKR